VKPAHERKGHWVGDERSLRHPSKIVVGGPVKS